ncbi:hypothetical protein FJU31_06055 [Stenotrophomonas cyclobalanopsidis]|uniref:Uncharacterized protein n=1 Tax=Stenotrophomonas cyclobalanopsidis TaxID=2771362 RepID=A0ABQ6T2X8_9GAMM|nr:hypothetical protein [Stenotrophomonas cyclobalanopsidis]KAA9001519.1 hypothetical protein FJU31_06055 [Stenotrophomonas cyclobalanopsidis]
MQRAEKDYTFGTLAGWGSALATFGLVQGSLYLKSFWGRFGLDPFQFVAVSELALAGLAAMGVALFLMALAILLGGWLEAQLSEEIPKGPLRAWLSPIAFFGGLGALIWWANAWPILIGMTLTIACAVVVQLSPLVPRGVKESPWLTYFLVMAVYVSIASSWLGYERAGRIAAGGEMYTATVSTEAGVRGGLKLIGRLGDTYALWDPSRQATTLVPAGDIKTIEIMRKANKDAKVEK